MCIFYDVTILSDWLIDKICWIAIIAVMGDFPLIYFNEKLFQLLLWCVLDWYYRQLPKQWPCYVEYWIQC